MSTGQRRKDKTKCIERSDRVTMTYNKNAKLSCKLLDHSRNEKKFLFFFNTDK